MNLRSISSLWATNRIASTRWEGVLSAAVAIATELITLWSIVVSTSEKISFSLSVLKTVGART